VAQCIKKTRRTQAVHAYAREKSAFLNRGARPGAHLSER